MLDSIIIEDYHVFSALKQHRKDALCERRGSHDFSEQVSSGGGEKMVRPGDKKARGSTLKVHRTNGDYVKKVMKGSGFLRV